jgi:hypothetical protein
MSPRHISHPSLRNECVTCAGSLPRPMCHGQRGRAASAAVPLWPAAAVRFGAKMLWRSSGYGQRRRAAVSCCCIPLWPTASGGGQLLLHSIVANGVGAVLVGPRATRRGGWRWLGVPKPLCDQLGAPNVGSRAPKNQPPRQRKSKGRRERGGGVRAPPKTSHTPPIERGARWRPPFGADEPNDQAGNATTRRAAPNQIRAEQTPRAERPRPEHHDKQEPAPHNEQTKRPRRGSRHMAPTNPNQHTDQKERARTPPPRPGAPTPPNQQTEQKKARGNPLSGPPAGRNVVSEPPAIASLLARMASV